MKVFIAWSEDTSHRVAMAFRRWLPNVLQFVDAFVSSEDVYKGGIWNLEVARELEMSHFGIICVTPENLHADWLHFEAGALFRFIEEPSSRVVPFLFATRPSDLSGPLRQFQAVQYTKEDVWKLVQSIDKSAPEEEQLEEARCRDAFEKWWVNLKEELDELQEELSQPTTTTEAPQKPEEEAPVLNMLELVADALKAQQAVLSQLLRSMQGQEALMAVSHQEEIRRAAIRAAAGARLRETTERERKHAYLEGIEKETERQKEATDSS